MIDFQVAYDKLAQFESADDIAEYMESCGIKAKTRSPKFCAISLWMTQQTELPVITADKWIRARVDNQTVITEELTNAMKRFVFLFDSYLYPELME